MKFFDAFLNRTVVTRLLTDLVNRELPGVSEKLAAKIGGSPNDWAHILGEVAPKLIDKLVDVFDKDDAPAAAA